MSKPTLIHFLFALFFITSGRVYALVTLKRELEALYNGDATYYDTGLGSCGHVNKNTDLVVALSTKEYNSSKRCGQKISVTYQDKHVVATIVDSCPGCSQYSIDLSPAAFKALASLDKGRISVSWKYT